MESLIKGIQDGVAMETINFKEAAHTKPRLLIIMSSSVHSLTSRPSTEDIVEKGERNISN